jgi:hypothetical protein
MSGRDLYRFKTCISFFAKHTSLLFYWFITLCCVFFSRISPEILAFSGRFFSFNGICCIFLCSFRFLCFIEYWNFFLRYCTWKSCYVCVLGWSWYIYPLWIDALLICFFGIHLTAIINTILFLELIGSDFSW